MSTPTLDDPSTWVPQGESPKDILNDAVNLIATILCGFGYGIVFTLYCICARTLYFQLGRREMRKQARFMLVYITILTLCGGLYFASASRVVQLAYVEFRNYPLGPFGYTVATFSSPDNLLGLVTYFIVSWMTDAILIWRVYVLYSSKNHPWLVIAVPCILYVASFAMSVVLIFESSRPSQSFWSIVSVRFGLAYYALTAAITIIATMLMTLRLLFARNQYIKAMGNSAHAKQYLSIATMLIESSALYGIWSIIFIGLYAVNHPMQQIFLGTLTDVAIIALLLIIFRVSQDKAWKMNTEQAFTSVEWRSRTESAPSKGRYSKYIKPSFQSQPESSMIRFEDSVTVQSSTDLDGKKGESPV